MIYFISQDRKQNTTKKNKKTKRQRDAMWNLSRHSDTNQDKILRIHYKWQKLKVLGEKLVTSGQSFKLSWIVLIDPQSLPGGVGCLVRVGDASSPAGRWWLIWAAWSLSGSVTSSAWRCRGNQASYSRGWPGVWMLLYRQGPFLRK